MDGRGLALVAPWALTALVTAALVLAGWTRRGHWLHSRGAWRSVEWLIAAAIAAAVTSVRIPLASRHLATWDSVLFALGMERYDVLDARPHPPGYPVYIALGKAAAWLAPDANAALVGISLLCHAGAVFMLYVLVRRWGSPRAAVAAAFTFGIAPVPLYNSLIATTYPFEAFFSVAAAWMALWYRDAPGWQRACAMGIAFALGVGVRQSLAIFLSPLLAWAVITAPTPWRRCVADAALAAGAALAAALAWLVPMVALSGGWDDYRAATSLQTEQVLFALTVFEHGAAAWADLWPRFRLYTEPERWTLLPITAMAVAFAAAQAVLRRRGGATPQPNSAAVSGPSQAAQAATQAFQIKPALPVPQTPEPVPASRQRMSGKFHAWVDAVGATGFPLPPAGRVAFLAAWTLPATAFYLLVFNGWDKGPDGYILILSPAFYVAAMLATDAALRSIATGKMLAVTALVLMAPAVPFAAQWDNVADGRVLDHDQWTDAWLALNDDPRFDPGHAAIVTSFSWAHVKWHHPDHVVWSMMRIPDPDGDWFLMLETQHHEDDRSFYRLHIDGPDGARHDVPAGIERIVLFDFQIAGENGGPRLLHENITVHEAFLDNGWRILYIDVAPGDVVEDLFEVPVNRRG